MTVDIRPDPLAVARSILDEADWDLADDTDTIALHPVTGWVPTAPPPPHHCPDGICADLAAERAAIHQAADWRSLEAWARDRKANIRRAKAVRRKTARGKRVKARRKQLVGQT